MAPTWRRPGPERAAGSSPASPRLPLPCPGKGFGERRTGRSCARGRRPSSGRRTSPGCGCPSRPVCWEPTRQCPASRARPRRDRLDAGRRRSSVHPQPETRRNALPEPLPSLCAAAPPPAPAGRPGEESEAAAPPWPVLALPRSSRAGRIAAASAELGPGARNAPPTTLAHGFAPQASSGCILSGFALNFNFLCVICFLFSSQCTESFQTWKRFTN